LFLHFIPPSTAGVFVAVEDISEFGGEQLTPPYLFPWGYCYSLQASSHPGSKGHGIGEYIKYTFMLNEYDQPNKGVADVLILNGYWKSIKSTLMMSPLQLLISLIKKWCRL
jgi:hypothetical protein